jgi:four helix bundle protein
MKGNDISDRFLEFGAGVLLMTKEIPKDPAARHVIQQLVRAATGGGANYEETRAAESRSDFIHKLSVAAKETREALYWLRLIERALYTGVAVTDLIQEANQLVAILTSSIKTAKRNGATRHRSPD